MTWTLQGMWVTMCLLCVTTALSAEGGIVEGVGFYLGLIVFIIGFGLEVAADMQKTRFRKNPENKDKFISTGLWAKSRHPNYLGEIILWLGVALMSMESLERSRVYNANIPFVCLHIASLCFGSKDVGK